MTSFHRKMEAGAAQCARVEVRGEGGGEGAQATVSEGGVRPHQPRTLSG